MYSGGSCIGKTGRSLTPAKYSEIEILRIYTLELVYENNINENIEKLVHILTCFFDRFVIIVRYYKKLIQRNI